MRRKKIFLIIVLCVLSSVLFLGYKTYKDLSAKKSLAAKIHKLPALPFEFSGPVNDLTGKSVIVNYFSPDCDHCQYMIKQIIANKKHLVDCQLIMITADTSKATGTFKKEYGLDSLGFVHIGIDRSYRFSGIFGSANVPSFFIYNTRHELTKTIIGEVKIENIVNAIK